MGIGQTDHNRNVVAPYAHTRKQAIEKLIADCHEANINWWRNLETGELKDRNTGELLMLCVSELAEALEGHRKNLQDDKLPHHPMITVELADCLIRVFDLAGGKCLNVAQAFEEKMQFNSVRSDHKIEQRKAVGGKQY